MNTHIGHTASCLCCKYLHEEPAITYSSWTEQDAFLQCTKGHFDWKSAAAEYFHDLIDACNNCKDFEGK